MEMQIHFLFFNFPEKEKRGKNSPFFNSLIYSQ